MNSAAILVLVTALVTAIVTLALAALVYKLVVAPRLERRAEQIGEDLQARVRAGVQQAGEDLLPKFREQVALGFRDALAAAARGEHVEESVRAMARSGADLLEDSLGALFGRRRPPSKE